MVDPIAVHQPCRSKGSALSGRPHWMRTDCGLVSAWGLFDTHCEEGQLIGYAIGTMDDLIHWKGFAQAMIEAGRFAEEAGALVLSGFEEKNGTLTRVRIR
ncbi:hypothetical protein D9M71_515310 [compost metagenome]